jgi:hypothetical protein
VLVAAAAAALAAAAVVGTDAVAAVVERQQHQVTITQSIQMCSMLNVRGLSHIKDT